MDNKEINNFALFIKNYDICIPMIQRDYAHGREGDSIRSIRTDFINDVLSSLKSRAILDLNFIYGIENKITGQFMLIDGQQRLTSLYLICWFLAVAEERQELFCQMTRKFDYQIRESSSKFFSILGERAEDGKNLKYSDDFKLYVKDSEFPGLSEFGWFRDEWMFDPTVGSAVRFLDDLKTKYNSNSEKYSGHLTEVMLDGENCPLQFMCSCQDSSSAASGIFSAENRAALTYINMNARGKLLSDFENLKALIHRLDKDTDGSGYYGQSFVQKYDTHYIDIFLSMAEKLEGSSRLTLEGKIKKMDDLTRGLLLNVYNDLKSFDDEKHERINFFGLMDAVRRGADIPGNYFKLLSYIIRRYEESPDDGKIIVNYCQSEDGDKRYGLFRTIWYDFCIGALNAASSRDWENLCDSYPPPRNTPYDEEGWERLCSHLGLTAYHNSIGVQDVVGDNWTSTVFCLNRLVQHVAANSGKGSGVTNIIDYLCGIDPVAAAASIFGESRKKLFAVTLMEEKIKAKIIKKQPSAQTLLDAVGCSAEYSRYDHRIRYLLYISGFWKADNDSVWSDDTAFKDAWNKFTTYSELDKTYKPHCNPDMNWRKAFYLMSLPSPTGQKLPVYGEVTYWKPPYLSWDKADADIMQPPMPYKRQIEKVQTLYDTLTRKKLNCGGYVSQAKGNLQRSSWLYYVLDRDFAELLLENKVSFDSTRGYLYSGENFFMYVLKRDIAAKGYEHLPKASISYNRPLENVGKQCVRPGENSVYSNARNITFSMQYVVCFDDRNYEYSRKGTVVQKYKYAGTLNNSDAFELYTDSKSVTAHKGTADSLLRELYQIFDTASVDPFLAGGHQDAYREMVFDGDYSELERRINHVLSQSSSLNGVSLRKITMGTGNREIIMVFGQQISFANSGSHRNPVIHEDLLNTI